MNQGAQNRPNASHSRGIFLKKITQRALADTNLYARQKYGDPKPG